MEASPFCETVIVELETEQEGLQSIEISGDNHSTRRMGTHDETPPASPVTSTASSTEDEPMGTPVGDSEEDAATADEGESQEQPSGDDMEEQRTPDRPPSPQAAPTTRELVADLHLLDHIARPTGYGANVTPPGCARVTPTQRESARRPLRYGEDALTTHLPATDPRRFHHLSVLADQDLPQVGSRPEDVNLSAHEVEGYEQAYPYARRYARPVPSSEIKALFNCMGLAQRGFLRVDSFSQEEFGLHPTVLSALMNADWRLESQLGIALLTPVYPSVMPRLDINTSIHNLTDARFSVAPMFMPVAPAVAFASRLKWLPVQRGLIQSMEELARAAIHNQSGILHAMEEVQAFCGLSARAPDLMLALETMLVQQTAVLVELVHQVTYAHRHAYVRESPAWFKHGVLRQPLFNQRQLFQIPQEAYSHTEST